MEFLGRAHSKFLVIHPGDAGQFTLPSSHNFIILHVQTAMLDVLVTIGTVGPLEKCPAEEFDSPVPSVRVEKVVHFFPAHAGVRASNIDFYVSCWKTRV